tara:strand:- start:2834 stop:3154 length:321 start_codon:yes stop_codon:yes gene_type:complete
MGFLVVTQTQNDMTFAQTKTMVSNVWKITTFVLSICMGGIIGATTMFYQVDKNSQDILTLQKALIERHEFMSCATREVDRLDVQSVDPEHRAIKPRCQLVLPSIGI